MEIISILKQIIKDNPNLSKKYELIGVFGSCLKNSNFKDIDLFSVGSNQIHQKFKFKLKRYFKGKGYNLLFFKTIKHFPQRKDSKTIFVHDLHYSDFQEYQRKEWPVVIDFISNNLYVLIGSKKDLPRIILTKSSLYYPRYNWCKSIKTKKDWNNFKNYFIEKSALDYKFYPQLHLKKDGENIISFFKYSNWKSAKKEILNILRVNN